jgi:alpha-tubulin suppressor-like RCC1 family protein
MILTAAQGSLWSWGDNGNSQTGLGTGVTHVTPQIVGGSLVGRTVVQACGGSSHGLAVTDDGVVHSFGTNTAGQLGTSAVPASGEVRNVPAAVYSTTGGLSGKFAIGVACGYTTSFVLLSDRTVVAFGDNTNGALGIGSADPSSNLPTAVSGLTNVASIAAGQHHAIVRTAILMVLLPSVL